MNLIADIGGTNARFAVAGPDAPRPQTVRSYRNADFGCFDDMLAHHLALWGTSRPGRMVIAVAGPVTGNRARLTNRDWELNAYDLAQRFQAESVEIINDLTALGYAATQLGQDQLRVIVPGTTQDRTEQALVVGIGTGFNVSPVIPCGDHVICPSVEAGHASLPTGVARVMAQHRAGLPDDFPTIEHCFSGRGLGHFLGLMTGDSTTDPAIMVARYGADGADKLTSAIDLYAELFGHLLRDLSLTYLPTGGFYLAGGVARSILATPAENQFRRTVQQPTRFHAGQIPVWTIVQDTAALIGCARIACRV